MCIIVAFIINYSIVYYCLKILLFLIYASHYTYIICRLLLDFVQPNIIYNLIRHAVQYYSVIPRPTCDEQIISTMSIVSELWHCRLFLYLCVLGCVREKRGLYT